MTTVRFAVYDAPVRGVTVRRSVIDSRPLRRSARRAVASSVRLKETRPGPTDVRDRRATRTSVLLEPPDSAPRRANARASRREPERRTLTEPRTTVPRWRSETRSEEAATDEDGGGGGGGGGGAAGGDPGGGGGGGGGATTVTDPVMPLPCSAQLKA
jgi:uncharacterized membrane protein YgcG